MMAMGTDRGREKCARGEHRLHRPAGTSLSTGAVDRYPFLSTEAVQGGGQSPGAVHGAGAFVDELWITLS